MKIVKLLLVLLFFGLLFYIVFQPKFQNQVRSFVGASQAQDLLHQLEQSNFLPPPLRASLSAQNAHLTQTGVLAVTNLQRQQNGLAPLVLNPLLNQAAQNKLNDMFAQQYFEHVSPQGLGPSDLAKGVGYAYVVVGENLALGNFENDTALLQAWMDSPGHRANILNDRYQEIGIAVGKGMFEGRETWLAVQSFGTPLSACPSINDTLKQELEHNEAQITQWQKELSIRKTDIERSDRSNAAAYNAKVNAYNQLVDQLNRLIEQTKTIVSQYNSQVDTFNACLKD